MGAAPSFLCNAEYTASTKCWAWGLGHRPNKQNRSGATRTLLATTSYLVAAMSDFPSNSRQFNLT